MKKIGTLVTYGNVNYFVNSRTHDTLCKMNFILNLNKLNAFSLIDDPIMIEYVFGDLLDKCDKKGIKWDYIDGIGFMFYITEIAKLHSGDTFNKITGEHIANTKAQRLAFDMAYSFAGALDNYIYNTYSMDIFKAMDNTYIASVNASDHICNLTHN